jgi:hypothetical protein
MCEQKSSAAVVVVIVNISEKKKKNRLIQEFILCVLTGPHVVDVRQNEPF